MQRCLCSRVAHPASLLPVRPFSTSLPLHEKKRKKIARLKRNANLSKRQAILDHLAQTKPDPLTGYHEAVVYEKSKLKGILLEKSELWPASTSSRGPSTSDTVKASLDEGLESDTPYDEPKQLNFGLEPQDAKLLFEQLPQMSAMRHVYAKLPQGTAEFQTLHDEGMQVENVKREQLMRILDLRNANAKGLRFENTKRVLNAFGRNSDPEKMDTGSPEVQAAVLTLRIKNIRDHLVSSPKDFPNQRAITKLIQKRNKLLLYLKRRSVDRYTAALHDLGLEARAIEEEVIVTSQTFKGLQNAPLG